MIDAARIPTALRALTQWVLWQTEVRNGKQTKVPRTITGAHASTTDPSTWTTFDTALQHLQRGGFDGIGFVFTTNDPYLGIDLDGVIGGDEIDAWAVEVIHDLDSYAEVSPSGTGIHVIVQATLPAGGNRRGSVEIYESGRYFTMTGQTLNGRADVEERQEQLDALHARLIAGPKPKQEPARRPAQPVELDDQKLLDLACRAKNGPDFERLWNGDWSRYRSQSEADMALVGRLAFWTGGDPAQIDRLFQRSGLMRDKWHETRGDETYGAITIANVLASATDFYEPKQRADALNDQAPGEEWEAPLSLDTFTVPEFPLFVFPERLRRFVEQTASSIQVAPDLPATLVLGALCVPIARRYVLMPWPGRWEELVLWICSPLASSERKSETLRAALAPVRKQGREIRDLLRDEAAETKAEIKIKEAAYSLAIKQAATGKGDDARKADGDARKLAQDLANLEAAQVDPNFAFVADDSTPEGLVRRLGSHPVVVLASAEGGVLVTVIGARYGEGRTNIDSLNKSYTGEEIDVVRASGTKSVTRPLSVQILSPQPFVIEDLLREHGRALTETGVISRYLYSSVPSLVGGRSYGQPDKMPNALDFSTIYDRLVGSPASKETPSKLTFDRACINIVNAVHKVTEAEAAAMSVRDPMRAWTLRLENHVERLAAVLHLITRAAERDLPGVGDPVAEKEVLAVSADACARAAILGLYFWCHAAATFAVAQGGGRRGHVRTLLGWILDGHRDRFTVRDAKRSHSNWEGDDVELALKELADKGYLRADDKPPSEKGGAPSPAFAVNPKFLEGGWTSAKSAKTPFKSLLQQAKTEVLADLADAQGSPALCAEIEQWFSVVSDDDQIEEDG